MKIYLLQATNQWDASVFVSIATCIVAIIYTVITLKILMQNNKSLKLSAYLELKKELGKGIFPIASRHCRANTLSLDETIAATDCYEVSASGLKIREHLLITDVLGNIEDIALLHEHKILDIDMIDAGFGYNILFIGNNPVIKGILNKYHTPENRVYNGFNTIYKLIRGSLSEKERTNYKEDIFL